MDSKMMFVGSVFLTGKNFPCKYAKTNVCVNANNLQEAREKIKVCLKEDSYFGLGEIDEMVIISVRTPEQKTFGIETFQFIP